MKCWGGGNDGQNGEMMNGDDRPTPQLVSGLPGTAEVVVAGGRHACLLTTDGRAACWGSNFSGELGNDLATGNSPVPVNVIED